MQSASMANHKSSNGKSSYDKSSYDKSSSAKPVSNKNSWLILTAIAGPMLLAYLIFKTGIGMPGGTVNKGDLLLPATSIASLDMVDSRGVEREIFSGKKLWRMVIVGDAQCDALCREQLYLSRQVHIRLAEKSVRVERLFLNTATTMDAQFQEFLETEHPRLMTLSIQPQQWRELFSKTSIADHSLNGHHIYYVDQQGFAMMSYNSEHDGGELLADIKRLLKYSYEG